MKNNKQINYLSLLMLSLFVSTQTMSMTINISNQNSTPSTIPTQKSLLCSNISNKSSTSFIITPQKSLIPLPTIPNKNSSPALNHKVSNRAYASSSLLVDNLGYQPVKTFSVSSKSTPATPAPLPPDSPNNASISEATAKIFCIRFKKPQDLIHTLLSTAPPQNRTFLKYLILTNNIYFLKAALAQAIILMQEQTITTKSLTTCKEKLAEELYVLFPLVKNDPSLVIFFNHATQACYQN